MATKSSLASVVRPLRYESDIKPISLSRSQTKCECFAWVSDQVRHILTIKLNWRKSESLKLRSISTSSVCCVLVI